MGVELNRRVVGRIRLPLDCYLYFSGWQVCGSVGGGIESKASTSALAILGYFVDWRSVVIWYGVWFYAGGARLYITERYKNQLCHI